MSFGAWLVVAVIVAWLLFTEHGRATFVVILTVVAIGLALASCERDGGMYRCSFRYQAATYQVTEHELRKRGELIVVKRDGREFAFKRDSLTACERE